MDKEALSKMGKRNRGAGAAFELKVRKELEAEGWIVCKWLNNIDLEENKLISARRKWNPFLRALSLGTGFPDFIIFKSVGEYYKIIGVEAKTNGILDKIEKEKSKWYLKNRTFQKLLIAREFKEGKTKKIKYEDFKEKYLKK